MGRKAEEMSPLAVSRLKEPGLHFVGGVAGLALQVLPTGGRTWVLRAMVGSRRRDMGLGGFPDVTLAGAKEAARDARKLIREGIDPIESARAAKSALRAAAAKSLTFTEAADAYLAAHEASWRNPKHRQQWENTLKTYAYPHIGKLSVSDVELAHVMKILEPIWQEKTETAKRLRGRIEMVLDWATARGYRQGLNPARWRGHLDKLLARPSKVAKPEHHAALPLNQMGAFVKRLREADGLGARALEFAILTAARSGEVRGATWGEIDLKAKVWTIPADRMKAGREHRVPLSQAALDLLGALPRIAGSDLLFTAPRGGQLSDMTLLAVLRRMNVDAVPHGFRSTFRDWCSERTNYPRDAAEMALAHTIGDKVEAAYRRGDLFEKRRRMMTDWAGFCARVVVESDNVVPMQQASQA
ncbi:MAG: integrase arm-type DNA-binding domain-containing protein [Phenylobacterium sp.]|nr:integrase arm-type DNA-binding domain-containing protein [Phenylobacterium sp.]